MANYFSLVPNFEYVSRLPDAKISDYIRVKNLFKKVNLREDIYQYLTYFTKYQIQGDDRPENVAFEIYEDSTLDWVVLLANNIINIQTEWPMPQQAFDRYLLDKYDDNYNTLHNGVHHYETVEVKDSNDIVIVRKGLEVSKDFNITYYDWFLGGLTTANNIVRPVTNYEYEEKKENEKRNIFLLRREYMGVILDDIEDLMPYKKGSTEYVNEHLKKAENIRLYQ